MSFSTMICEKKRRCISLPCKVCGIGHRFMKLAVLVCLSFFYMFTNSQTIVWQEDFTYPDGTIQGSGTPPKWTRDVSACTFSNQNDYFEVKSGQMEGRDLDGEAVWISESIDISNYSSVCISTDVSMGGRMEPGDYIRFYYKIDGGTEILFSQNGDISDDFSPLVASQSGLIGTNLVIVVRMYNNGGMEIHRFDNMVVFEPIAGDFCNNAIIINEVDDLLFNTLASTVSWKNPGCGGTTDPVDLWYAYTATETGLATIDLCGSSFDTRLAVWDACSGNVLGCNDNNNACGPGSSQSIITMDVTSGITYYIQVGGNDASTGTGYLSINVMPYPSNDDCNNAISIGEVSNLPFSTITATASGVNPDCGGIVPVDIWYTYTPASSGVASIDLCGSDYDSRLAVWDACNGNQIDCNDDSDFCGSSSLQSYLAIEVTAGVTYYIQVGGYSNSTGSGDLSLSLIPYPVNDDCSNALPIGEVSGLPYTTIGATAGGDNPGCGGIVDPVDIWYEYTATVTGSGSFSLCGSNFNTRLAIWDACGGTVLTCNDNSSVCGWGSQQSHISMDVVSGTTYYIQVGGNNALTGSGQLSVEVYPFPDNDNCLNATSIGEVTDLLFSTVEATASGISPNCGGTNPIDIWYEYSPSASGVANIDLCGSSFDTRLAIWDACNGNQIDCNDDSDNCGNGSYQSYLSIKVNSGNVYYIQVGGYNNTTGNGDLSISLTPYAENNECVDATPVGEITGMPFTLDYATASGSNPGCGGTTNPVDLWYEYTPSLTGLASFSLCMSNFDTRLAIWDECGGNVLSCNNNSNICSPGSKQSYIELNVSLGNTYIVQVGGRNDNTGSGILSINISPSTTGHWTGNIDSDWATTGNWMNGTIPDASIDAQIINVPPNYPVIDETASCKNLLIDAGNSVTVGTGGAITLAESCWNDGALMIVDGSMVITGNLNCTSGSTTSISGGNIILDGWYESGPGTSASGKVELSGGTINLVGDISLNNVASNSIMSGSFVLNLGGSIEMDASSFSEITGGTIIATGAGNILPFSNTGEFHVHNMSVNSTGSYLFARDGYNSSFSINNDFTISGGNVQFLSIDGTGKPYDFTIGRNLNILNGALVEVDVANQLILTSDLVVDGSLTQSSGEFVFNGVTNISGSGTTILNNTLINTGSILNGNSLTPLNIAGDFTNNGTYNHNNGTLIFNGINQSIGGSSVTLLNNLTITSTSTTTVNSTGTGLTGVLKSDGNLIVAGGLTLTSTSSQTALIDGSGTGNISGTIEIQRYLPSGFGYHYVSSPFSSATAAQFSDEVDLGASFPPLYRYNEDRESSGWVNYSDPVNLLEPFYGYALNFGSSSTPLTIDMEGEVNSSSYLLTLFNNNKTYTQGFNLIGNPYPSPVDWDASSGWIRTNIDNAVYYFNPGTADQYEGTYSCYVNGISSDGIASGIIAAMQGFFVHISDGTYPVSGNISINNNARVVSLTPVYHKNTRNDKVIRLCAGFSDNGTKCDPLAFYFGKSDNRKFDNRYDALKLENTDINVPNLYGITSDLKKLSVYSLPGDFDSLLVVPIGLTTNKDGELYIELRGLENFPENFNLYIKDSEEGIYYELKKLQYPLFNLLKGEYNNRFFLLISKGELNNLSDKNRIYNAFAYKNTITVYCESPYDLMSTMEIVNTMGQLVWQKVIHGNGLSRYTVNIEPGFYILIIRSRFGNYTRKIVLTN